MFEVHDLFGGIGAAILLSTYFLLQVNRIEAKSMLYSQLNATGSGLIAFSLLFSFNLSAFVIEVAWFAISLVGAAVTWKESRKSISG
ncbi:MAG: CBU_0592 family membrane protein [Aureliella sp.]